MDATDTKNSTDTKTIKVVDANEESSLDNSEESKESFTDSEEIDSNDSSSEEEVDEEKVDEILKKFEFLIVEVHPTRPGIKHTCPCHKQTIVDSDLEDDLDDDEEEEDPRKQYRCLLFPWETVRRDLDMDESTARNSNF